MKITIYGSGYVGLVTGTCMAEVGNDVLCVDIDTKKIENLKNGIPDLSGRISCRLLIHGTTVDVGTSTVNPKHQISF